jgi:hypothetical protein
MEILMAGHRLRVVVDGVVTVDEADLSVSHPNVAWPVSGRIGLQDSHATISGSVEYRNVRIIRLDATGIAPES